MNQEQRELQLTAFRELISLMGNEAQLLTSSGASYPIKGKFSNATQLVSSQKGSLQVGMAESVFEAERSALAAVSKGDLLLIDGKQYRIVSLPVFSTYDVGFVYLSENHEAVHVNTNFL